MQWTLHGQAVVLQVNVNEPCVEEPLNLYIASFPGIESCMHFCGNVGKRAPAVNTLQSWENLKTHMVGKVTSGSVWLPVTVSDSLMSKARGSGETIITNNFSTLHCLGLKMNLMVGEQKIVFSCSLTPFAGMTLAAEVIVVACVRGILLDP